VYNHIAEFYPITWDGTSLSIPLWTDFDIELGRDQQGFIRSRYSPADRVSSLQIHDPQQWQGYVDTQQHQHYKILSPWHIEASRPVRFHLTPHEHMLRIADLVTVPPGQIDFVYQRAIHINTFWHAGPDGNLSHLLEAGTGLARLTPVEPVQVVVRVHSVTLAEFDMRNYTPKFMGLYRERVTRDQDSKGCPFS
jgi:hypothetical protein